jgi:hypothetical protein
VKLWLGPQLSIGLLLERWLVAAAAPPGVDLEVARSFEEARRSALELIRQTDGLTRFNLLSLLAVPLLGIPSFRASAPLNAPLVAVGSAGSAAGLTLASLLLGLALSALFYGLLGQAVREGRVHVGAYLGDFARLYSWMLVLAGLLIAVLTLGTLPALALLGLATTSAPFVVSVLAPILLGVILWVFFYAFFTTDALFVSRVPPRVAIQHSIAVVRYNFWSSLGFIVLLIIISEGFHALWVELARGLGTPGVAVAIVGHIYISVGLTVASMTYYKERFGRLRSS